MTSTSTSLESFGNVHRPEVLSIGLFPNMSHQNVNQIFQRQSCGAGEAALNKDGFLDFNNPFTSHENNHETNDAPHHHHSHRHRRFENDSNQLSLMQAEIVLAQLFLMIEQEMAKFQNQPSPLRPAPADRSTGPVDNASDPWDAPSVPLETPLPPIVTHPQPTDTHPQHGKNPPPGHVPVDTHPQPPVSPTPGGSDHGSGNSKGSAGRPSWADLTTINNNNGGLVAPAYFAQHISSDAVYKPAHLGNLQLETHGAQYDEGLMIDERGMKPEDLVTVKTYEAVNTFESNETTGKYLGSIEIPKNLDLLRPITDYGNGIVVSTNSTATIIQPDGKEYNYAKTYIGPNAKFGDGHDILVGTPVGHTGWFGNEGAITQDEALKALHEGVAPQHALNLYVPVDVLSRGNKGVAGPAKYADVSYLKEYTSSNSDLKLGTLLAIKKDVTPEQLGLQTNFGKAVLASFQEFGAYIADTTHEENALGLDTTVGVKNMVQKSGQEKQFEQDMKKIIAAADAVI